MPRSHRYNRQMNFLLDNLWIPAFLIAYALGGIYAATAALIAAMAVTVVAYWILERRIHKMHLVAAITAAVLGGITLYVHDPIFIKFKPTAVYLLFAMALLGSHLIGDKVLMARLPQKTIVLPDAVWPRVNFAWAVFFLFCAALNVYVALNFDESVWVKFKAFGFTGLSIVFILAHLPFLHKYLPQEQS